MKSELNRWRIMTRSLNGRPTAYLVPEDDYQRAIESFDIIASAIPADDLVIRMVELP